MYPANHSRMRFDLRGTVEAATQHFYTLTTLQGCYYQPLVDLFGIHKGCLMAVLWVHVCELLRKLRRMPYRLGLCRFCRIIVCFVVFGLLGVPPSDFRSARTFSVVV